MSVICRGVIGVYSIPFRPLRMLCVLLRIFSDDERVEMEEKLMVHILPVEGIDENEQIANCL